MPTPEELIALTDSLKGVLRDEQIERIHRIANKMPEDKRAELHATLKRLQKKHVEEMQKELDTRQAMQGLYEAKQKEKTTQALHAAEEQEHLESEAEAERLLQELNQL